MSTRRDVIQTLAVATAAAALESPIRATAQPVDVQSRLDRQALTAPALEEYLAFIKISGALTGIEATLLAPETKPGGGADPTQEVKLAYFHLATADAENYGKLKSLFFAELAKEAKQDGPALTRTATALVSGPEPIANLARSIIMAWYFGLWYEWDVGGRRRFTVVSAQAYTEGWIWRIAQAHPPGYSNLRFGYWAQPPVAGFQAKSLEPVAPT